MGAGQEGEPQQSYRVRTPDFRGQRVGYFSGMIATEQLDHEDR